MHTYHHHASEPTRRRLTCPHCGGSVQRVHRHVIDMMINTLWSVRRFRCLEPECGWEGRKRMLPPHQGAVGQHVL